MLQAIVLQTTASGEPGDTSGPSGALPGARQPRTKRHMKRISYAGNSVLTGDEIADAVVNYAEALARHDSAATIDMPVRAADGSVVTASLLIGPASQLVSMPEPQAEGDLTDERLVHDLERRTSQLESPRPVVGAATEQGDAALFNDLEYPGVAAD